MGALRRWFGPSREEVWRRLSEQIGGRYVEGSFWKGDKVEATHGEWTIVIDTYTVHANNAHVPFTRLRAPYVNPGGFRFSLSPRNIFSNIGRFFGMQDVEIGHEVIDRAFIIKATSDGTVRDLLSSATLRQHLEAHQDVHLTVEDDQGWFRPKFPEGVDALVLTVRGHVKDVARLEQLYRLLADTLDELCRIGSAYETAPDVTLR